MPTARVVQPWDRLLIQRGLHLLSWAVAGELGKVTAPRWWAWTSFVPAKDTSAQEGPLPSFHSLKCFGITSSVTLNEPPDDGDANTALPTP